MLKEEAANVFSVFCGSSKVCAGENVQLSIDNLFLPLHPVHCLMVKLIVQCFKFNHSPVKLFLFQDNFNTTSPMG